MNCYECATIDSVERAAIATCASCGAAVCAQHAHVESRVLPQPASLGRPLVHETRVISCSACQELVARHNVPLAAAQMSS